MANLELLQSRLNEAEAAYHVLLTHKKPVSVTDADGRTIEYSLIAVNKLAGYISGLKIEISHITGKGRRRPIRFRF